LGGNPIIQRNFIDSTAGGIITHYNPFDINIRENFISNYGLSEISDIAGFYLVSDTHSSVQKSFKRNFIIDAHKPQATMYHDYTDAYTHAVYFDVDIIALRQILILYKTLALLFAQIVENIEAISLIIYSIQICMVCIQLTLMPSTIPIYYHSLVGGKLRATLFLGISLHLVVFQLELIHFGVIVHLMEASFQ
jgi:hypothetical protein